MATTAPPANLLLSPLCGDVPLRGQSQPGYQGTYSVTDHMGGLHAYSGPLNVTIEVDVREGPAGTYGDSACTAAGFEKAIKSATLSSPPGSDSVACTYPQGTYRRDNALVTIRLTGECSLTQGGVTYTATTSEVRQGTLAGGTTAVTPPLAPAVMWSETYTFATTCTSATCDVPGTTGTGGHGMSSSAGHAHPMSNSAGDAHPMAQGAGRSAATQRPGGGPGSRMGLSALPGLGGDGVGARPAGPPPMGFSTPFNQGAAAYNIDPDLEAASERGRASGFVWALIVVLAIAIAALVVYKRRTGRPVLAWVPSWPPQWAWLRRLSWPAFLPWAPRRGGQGRRRVAPRRRRAAHGSAHARGRRASSSRPARWPASLLGWAGRHPRRSSRSSRNTLSSKRR